MEKKALTLKDFKALDDGPGGFSAYATKWGELDSVGDIVLPGAYRDTIPRFLKRGFHTHSHDWSFAQLVGYPTSAAEDAIGFKIGGQFHSAPHAQSVRSIALERAAAGMDVSVSIGYDLNADPIYIYAKDYAEELPKYLRADVLDEGLAKAKDFPRVRLLPGIELYEVGIVAVPALASALMTDVKSAASTGQHAINVKGLFEDEIAARTSSPYALFDALCAVVWKLESMAYVADTMQVAIDIPALYDEAAFEYNARLRESILSGLGYSQSADEGAGMASAAKDKGTERGQVDSLRLGLHLQATVDMAGSVIARVKQRVESRVKENRELSTSNIERLEALLDALDGLDDLKSEIRGLIERNKKPKDEEKAAARPQTPEEIRQMVARALVETAQRKQGAYAHGY